MGNNNVLFENVLLEINLTCFAQLVLFYTPWKHQKTSSFLMFVEGNIKRSSWNELIRNTAWIVSVFRDFLVRIQSECRKVRARKTPNTDTFHAVDSWINLVCYSVYLGKFIKVLVRIEMLHNLFICSFSFFVTVVNAEHFLWHWCIHKCDYIVFSDIVSWLSLIVFKSYFIKAYNRQWHGKTRVASYELRFARYELKA